MISDVLKIVGMLGVIGMIAFDIVSVRRKDRSLRQTLDAQASELAELRKSSAEDKAYYEQALEDADQRRAKAKAKENELMNFLCVLKSHRRKV